jgi:hypothetical protein
MQGERDGLRKGEGAPDLSWKMESGRNRRESISGIKI